MNSEDLAGLLGARLKELREAAGLSQVALSAKVGTTQVQIVRYEKGQQSMSLQRLYEVAGALGVYARDLLV